MTVRSCPLCGFSVNSLARRCPECGADLTVPPEEAHADLQARGLPFSGPWAKQAKRSWTRRGRLAVIVAAALLALLLLAPLLSGYFGPEAAAYVTTWRPWRSHITVRAERTFPERRPERATMEAEYRDPWPGQARSPGWQHDFLTVKRVSPWLPWVVTERGSGP